MVYKTKVFLVDLFWIDIANSSLTGGVRIEPATEVANVLFARIVGFFDLDAGIGFDMGDNTDMPITAIGPANDGSDLWGASCSETSCACASCPLATVAPVRTSPRSQYFCSPSTLAMRIRGGSSIIRGVEGWLRRSWFINLIAGACKSSHLSIEITVNMGMEESISSMLLRIDGKFIQAIAHFVSSVPFDVILAIGL